MPDNVFYRRVRRVKNLVAESAWQFFNRPAIRSILGRRHVRALLDHEPSLPRLHEGDTQIVAALEKNGVYMTSIEALGLSQANAVVRKAADMANDFGAEAHRRAAMGEQYTIVPPRRVASDPEIFLLGLQDRLLDIAENYIGLPPAYDGVTINYTVADGQEISTRQWHRDREDRRMLKVAIYLNDVDETSGPFQLIPRHDTMQNDLAGYNYEQADDAALIRRLGPNYLDDVVSCSGPSGTVIFADTARFYHRGKPAIARDRMAIFYSYFAHRPRHPFFCERSGISRNDIARLAEALPPRQQSAALWRQRLSLALRLIPPAAL